MSQNEYSRIFAKVGFDTAEDEPPKVSLKWGIDPPRGVDLPISYSSGLEISSASPAPGHEDR